MEKYKDSNIVLDVVEMPNKDNDGVRIFLTEETMEQRKQKILKLMEEKELDTIIVYTDLEHGSNFSYLTGFVPRFEEGLLVLHKDGDAYLLLGNENTKMVNYARIKAQLIHVPYFSLPNQPMGNSIKLEAMLRQAKVAETSTVGIVGWKLFTSEIDNNNKLFDVPFYIVEALQSYIPKNNLINATDLFIHSDYGARATCNANEIAHYEFGSSLASDCVLEAYNQIEIGKTEMEIANYLNAYGQHNNVVTICASGERFKNANVYPSNNTLKKQDRLSITAGYAGGLSSRAGYLVENETQLKSEESEYLNRVAKPYYGAIVAWLENIKIGLQGNDLYHLINTVLPQEKYHWFLNPGHLTADEEWMSSPVYANSNIELKSGMLLQIDIIPSVSGYGGSSAENGIALADEKLQKEISQHYPEMWKRIEQRKAYIKNVLQIDLPFEVLPLSSTVAYYNPFFLNKGKALLHRPNL